MFAAVASAVALRLTGTRAQSGADVSGYLQRMEQAKAFFDDGQMAEGDALLDRMIAELNAGDDSPLARPR